jgi:hypothetical protein
MVPSYVQQLSVDFENGAPLQPFEKIYTNDIDLGDDYCLADSNIGVQQKTSRTLYRVVAINESNPPKTADLGLIRRRRRPTRCYVSSSERISRSGRRTGVVSNNDTVVWHSSYIDASHPIDGRISCAAHFRCHLPIASGSYLCAIHTEHAAKSISANLLRSVLL